MFTPRLVHKEQLVADIWSFVFDIPPHFEWKGGDHTVVIVEHENPDDRGNARALSFATLPFEGSLQLVTHCPEEGSTFKRALRDLEVGKTVTMTEAEPSFESEYKAAPAVFLVGGIGSVAVRSLLIDHDHRGDELNGRLIFYAQAGQHLFKKDFDALALRHPGFSVDYFTAEGLEEKGGIKEVEKRDGTLYYFAGIYSHEKLSLTEIAEQVSAEPTEGRKEVEFLSKLGKLL